MGRDKPSEGPDREPLGCRTLEGKGHLSLPAPAWALNGWEAQSPRKRHCWTSAQLQAHPCPSPFSACLCLPHSLPPSVFHPVNLTLLSLNLSLTSLSIFPSLTLSLLLSVSIYVALSISLPPLSSSISLTLSIFFFPFLPLSFPFCISWSLGLWPLSHVSSTNNIWAIDHPGHGGCRVVTREGAQRHVWRRGFKLLQLPCLGRGGQL